MTVKPWQIGYDATTGNFVELADIADADVADARRVAFENQVTAIMEQKGLLASQAEQYIANAYNQGTTLDALKHTAQQTGTAEERGDVWGASDDSSGKSYIDRFNLAEDDPNFLKVEASSDWQTNAALISSLYTEGFGREADTEGLKYWTEKLTDGSHSYADIAKSFGVSEEAQIRDAYHQEYGRDADDAGLQYWMSHEDGAGAALATMQHAGTLETQLRQEYADKLGQFSNEADRQANIAAGGFWTDVQEGGYKNLDWRGYTEGTVTGTTDAERIASAKANVTGVQAQNQFGNLTYDFGHRSETDMHDDFSLAATGTYSAGDQKTGLAKFQAAILGEQGYTDVNDPYRSTSGNQLNIRSGAQGLDDVRDILQQRENLYTISSNYDRDDAEGGSGIGRIFTLEEAAPYMSQATDLNDLASKLGEEKWALLTKELYKQPGDDWRTVTYPKGKGPGGVIHDPGWSPDQRGTSRNTLSNDYQVPVPPDYEGPDTANVTRENVNYMPDLDGTVPNRSLRNLDSSYTPAPQQAGRNQGAFVAGTSAQGVRRRQSSAARSGRSAMGTKQLARNNMQIKSLNI